jgi:hypothetical protein
MGLVTRLADHFGVSVAFLVDEDRSAPDANPKLAKMFRQASKLEPGELALLEDMMQSLLKHRPRKS